MAQGEGVQARSRQGSGRAEMRNQGSLLPHWLSCLPVVWHSRPRPVPARVRKSYGYRYHRDELATDLSQSLVEFTVIFCGFRTLSISMSQPCTCSGQTRPAPSTSRKPESKSCRKVSSPQASSALLSQQKVKALVLLHSPFSQWSLSDWRAVGGREMWKSCYPGCKVPSSLSPMQRTQESWERVPLRLAVSPCSGKPRTGCTTRFLQPLELQLRLALFLLFSVPIRFL